MTLQETGMILDILAAAYPGFYARQTPEEKLAAARLWQAVFDEPGEVVAAAVKALIVTKEDSRPPAIGAVKVRIAQLTRPEGDSEAEAWAKVRRAIGRSGYYAQAEYEALPPLLRRLVGSAEQLRAWSQMDQATVDSVVASNFQRSYRARVQAARERAALPAGLRAQFALDGEVEE